MPQAHTKPGKDAGRKSNLSYGCPVLHLRHVCLEILFGSSRLHSGALTSNRGWVSPLQAWHWTLRHSPVPASVFRSPEGTILLWLCDLRWERHGGQWSATWPKATLAAHSSSISVAVGLWGCAQHWLSSEQAWYCMSSLKLRYNCLSLPEAGGISLHAGLLGLGGEVTGQWLSSWPFSTHIFIFLN